MNKEKIKLSDYVINFLVEKGIDTFFGLTGGAVVHLFDSVEKNPKAVNVFCHHEQAAAFAAVSYSRVKNNLGVSIVTTGPGGTNALTGLAGAWLDSIPCLFLSGQTRLEHSSRGKPVRQIGVQGLDIIALVKPMTNFAELVDSPERIKYYLEKACYLALNQRPGPVWLDIPLNFQWTYIDPHQLESFSEPSFLEGESKIKANLMSKLADLLNHAERPVVVSGYGIRLSHAEEEFKQFIETLQIPFVTSWTTADLIETDHPYNMGRLGVAGQRGGNLVVQNSDLVITIGSHLNVSQTGTLFNAFARDAKIVMVNIDATELDFQTVKIDLPILADAKTFFNEFAKVQDKVRPTSWKAWHEKCTNYKNYNSYSFLKTSDVQTEYINSYTFIDYLSSSLGENDVIVVDGGGTNVYSAFQAFRIKSGQRLVISSGLCSMGSGLPECIGAYYVHKPKQVILLCGDGSFQLNIQELQTVFHHRLPIKMFIFNNQGYLSIRHTQQGFLEGNYAGSTASGGVSLPSYTKVANAYEIMSLQIKNLKELVERLPEILSRQGPILCEVMTDPNQKIIPTQGFYKMDDGTFRARPLEDMEPLLKREELQENMITKIWAP